MNRPSLNKSSKSEDLKNFYYLKEELITFCKQCNLQTTGSKEELIKRIIYYLDTGKKSCKKYDKHKSKINNLTLDTLIEENIVCSEKHRAFFKQEIGESFSFNVNFQKWLKGNSGKTYRDAINAYYQIKIKVNKEIGKQFEYNTYIRDFFRDNKGKTLKDAITCWQYKKSLKGHNKYEKQDLIVLSDN